jgi:cytochrome c oxidase cbb3-type subunit 3
MKFINYLTSIGGIDIFPLISLMIFFGFFTGLIIYVLRVKKTTIMDIERIPLDDTQPVSHE